MPPVPVGPRTTDSRDIRPARSWDGRLPGISPSCHGHVRHSPIQGKDLRPTSASCRGCPSRRCRSQPTVTEKTSFPKVVTSLEFAINNPESEMEHPCEWIATNPDFGCLRSPQDESWRSSRNSLLPRSGEIFRR